MLKKVCPSIVNKTKLSLKDAHKCRDWFMKKGLRFSATRFDKAISLLECLEPQYSSKDELWLISELFDLSEAYNYLKGYGSKDFISILQKSLKGCELLSNEKNTTARNYFFELKVATKLKKSGFKIDFGENADLKVNLKNCSFNVECKRVQTLNKINKNIKKAHEQLKKENSGDTQKRIIAMDFSKIFYEKYTTDELMRINIDEVNEKCALIENIFPAYIENNHMNILNEISFFIGHVRFPVIISTLEITYVNHFFTVYSQKNHNNCMEIALNAITS